MSRPIRLDTDILAILSDAEVAGSVVRLTEEQWHCLALEQADRFWSKVDRSGGPDACWLWMGGTDKDGYGKFQVNCRVHGRQVQHHVRSHRHAWELTNGLLSSEVLLMHSCDTPRCCNPKHTSPGTQLANRQDCASKGRTAKGRAHGLAKLDEAAVRTIRAEYIPRRNAGQLASRFGIDRGTVHAIATRKTWRHVA